jgi:CheY-like chemotaxis protein
LNDRASSGIVLVVDDDPSVLDLLQRLLAKEGYLPVVAISAFEGLDLAKKLVPALILLDVFMPELDGWQLLSMLKKEPELHGCRIIMLTVDDSIQKGITLGADGHLVKPVDRHGLMDLIRELGVAPSQVAARLAADRPENLLLESAAL